MTTLSLSKKTVGYDASRKWADGFDPALNQIACNIIYSDPKLLSVYFNYSPWQDRKLGIDVTIETQRMKVSHRIREAKYRRYFLEGFTLRNSAKYGETELEKVMNNPDYADWLLYALADEKEYGVVDSAILIDLKSVGAQLLAYPSILKNAHKGSEFVEFKYDDFPHDVVVGLWNLQRKGEVCQ